MTGAVLALGVTQITAWGTSYYCLGVLAGPISQDTGWSRGFVFLGFTVALLAMGIISSAVGPAIDRHGRGAGLTPRPPRRAPRPVCPRPRSPPGGVPRG